jgi:hypothetical protein
MLNISLVSFPHIKLLNPLFQLLFALIQKRKKERETQQLKQDAKKERNRHDYDII